MRPLTSTLLDIIRLLAAVGVVVSHIATARFGRSVPVLESLGHVCVAVFFVLSGFVIAWVTDVRETELRRFAIARLSRLYSVLIPALLVTALLDTFSMHLDPAFFASVVGPDSLRLDHYLRAVLFLNQTYGGDYAPGSNSPVWSLGYEAPYYAAFAICVFARGLWRVAGLAVLALVLGPAVLLLLPVWLMGVALYWLVGRHAPALRTLLIASGLLLCLLVSAPWLMRWQTQLYAVEAANANWIETGHSNQFVLFYAAGLLTCCLITIADYLGSLTEWRLVSLRRAIAYVAGSTFSIYLFHHPVLVFLYASTHYDRSSLVSILAVFVATIGICVALSFVSERNKRSWTKLIDALFRAVARLIRLPPPQPANEPIRFAAAQPVEGGVGDKRWIRDTTSS